MHGFFMHNKLWQKAKAIAAPVDYATVRKESVQSKMEAARAQRITLKRKLPKVSISTQKLYGKIEQQHPKVSHRDTHEGIEGSKNCWQSVRHFIMLHLQEDVLKPIPVLSRLVWM